jgi:hypothetical protein
MTTEGAGDSESSDVEAAQARVRARALFRFFAAMLAILTTAVVVGSSAGIGVRCYLFFLGGRP